ncbi:MAG: NIL domain-containing protein [Elusimicrobia bacterium]|nr:NIL domain-containing protein [Elusimicrobiota bacterium]
MPKKALELIFPQHLIKEPVVYQMSKRYEVVFNIRRAKVTTKTGEMVLELEGEESALNGAMEWLKTKGVKVEPITHDAVEG